MVGPLVGAGRLLWLPLLVVVMPVVAVVVVMVWWYLMAQCECQSTPQSHHSLQGVCVWGGTPNTKHAQKSVHWPYGE